MPFAFFRALFWVSHPVTVSLTLSYSQFFPTKNVVGGAKFVWHPGYVTVARCRHLEPANRGSNISYYFYHIQLVVSVSQNSCSEKQSLQILITCRLLNVFRRKLTKYKLKTTYIECSQALMVYRSIVRVNYYIIKLCYTCLYKLFCLRILEGRPVLTATVVN